MTIRAFRIASVLAALVVIAGFTATAGEKKVGKIGEIKVIGELSPAEAAAARAAADAAAKAKTPAKPAAATPPQRAAAPAAPASGPTRADAAGDAKKIGETQAHVDAVLAFNNEIIKPYIKIMGGDWLENSITGTQGNYKITTRFTKDQDRTYIVGLFDLKVQRGPTDAMSAVVLVNGVNPLNPKEEIHVDEIDGADVRSFRKYPMDGLTYNARDTAGQESYLKVIDSKEEYELGDVRPFVIPSNRSGRNLGRIDIFLFLGPAMPLQPGGTVEYDKPITKFTINMKEWSE